MQTFKAAIQTQPFTLTAELVLDYRSDAATVVRQAEGYAPWVDAVQVSDNPNGALQMSATAACALLLGQGIDPVPILTCRDKNLLALQSDLLGYGALGVSSLLLMHGDKLPQDHPAAGKQVFEIGGQRLLRTAAAFAGDPEIAAVSELFVGATATVFHPKRDWLPKTVIAKTDTGAQFIQTQLCFNMKALRHYVARLVEARLTWRVPIIVGLATLPSVDTAEWLEANLRGSLMPAELIKRIRQAVDPELEGVKICAELLQELADIPGISGAALMTPGDPATIPAAIEASGLRK